MSSENEEPGPWWKSRQACVVIGAIALMFFVAGLYAARFGWWLGRSLSLDPASWGEFGDYFGGVLNPIVALAALGLLAWSISIQRSELKATQKALRDQAESARRSVRLSALSIMMVGMGNLVAHLDVLAARQRQRLVDAKTEDERKRQEQEVNIFISRRDDYFMQQHAYFEEAKALLDEIKEKS